MPRKPSIINQTDLERTLRAFDKVGVCVEVTLEPDGRVRFTPVESGEPGQKRQVDYAARIKL